jgi:predicted amidohydrolase
MVRIAVCQLRLDIENPAMCCEAATDALRSAIDGGAHIIVLPELSNSGYNFASKEEVAERSVRLNSSLIADWKMIAKESDVVIIAGLAIEDENELWNASVVIDKSGLLGWYAKVHLFGDEPKYFKAGNKQPLVVNTHYGRIATMVCYDIEFTEWVRLTMLQGAQVLALPTNWPKFGQTIPTTPLEVVRVQAAASQNKIVVAAADRCGDERGLSWVGASVITDFDGLIKTMADIAIQDATQILYADIELPTNTAITEKNDIRKDRRPDLYSGLLNP